MLRVLRKFTKTNIVLLWKNNTWNVHLAFHQISQFTRTTVYLFKGLRGKHRTVHLEHLASHKAHN